MASVLKTISPVAKNAVSHAKVCQFNAKSPVGISLWRYSSLDLAARCQTAIFNPKSPLMDSRLFHTTVSRRDLDQAARYVGAGLATMGVIGPGVGVGVVFGALLMAYSRNPSLKQQLFSFAVMGFAMAEAIALFALMIAFLILFA